MKIERESVRILKYRIFKIFFLLFKFFYLLYRRKPPYPRKVLKEYRKILFVRLGPVGIGDVVLSTPALKALKASFPSSWLTVLLAPYTQDILSFSPFVDEVITFQPQGILSFLFLIKKLRSKGYELAIDPYMGYAFSPSFLTFFSGARVRVGFEVEGRGFLYTHPLKPSLSGKHMVEIILSLVEMVGGEAKDKSLEVHIPPSFYSQAKKFLKEKGIKSSHILVGIHPGVLKGEDSKQWNPLKFARLIEELNTLPQVKVLLLGGKQDENFCKVILSSLPHPPLVRVGDTSLGELMSLIGECHLFISNDSGPLHIAVALGIPTVSLMGPSIPERWRPWGEPGRHIVIRKDLPCSPCNLYYCKRGDHACMELITVEEVLEAAKFLLKKHYPDKFLGIEKAEGESFKNG